MDPVDEGSNRKMLAEGEDGFPTPALPPEYARKGRFSIPDIAL